MNINKEQNKPENIQMLAAQRYLYSKSKTIIGLQLILAVPIALITTLIGIFHSDFKSYISIWGIIVSILDIFVLTNLQKSLRQHAAQIQELFDHNVLGLKWNKLKIGDKPDFEYIYEQSQLDNNINEKLKNWYPQCVNQVPHHLGTIICQRANLWWDGKQRKHYSLFIKLLLVLITIILIVIGFCNNESIPSFFIYLIVPMSPTYIQGYRQFTEHDAAVKRLEQLKNHSNKLWEDALNGANIESLRAESRNLQDEIFDCRKRNPPVFDFIFNRFRDSNEVQMNLSAEQLVSQAKNIK